MMKPLLFSELNAYSGHVVGRVVLGTLQEYYM